VLPFGDVWLESATFATLRPAGLTAGRIAASPHAARLGGNHIGGPIRPSPEPADNACSHEALKQARATISDMRLRPGVLALIVCTVSGCGASTSTPAVTGPSPGASALPATRPAPHPVTDPSAPARLMGTPVPAPFAQYRQELVGKGEYQLINTATEQFVSVTVGGIHTFCSHDAGARCTAYVVLDVTEYSGNTQVTVSRSSFALANADGVRYGPATSRQAMRVVTSTSLLPNTMLQPDDDGDFASGSLVFLVPERAGRFSLLWQGRHVASFVTTAGGKLYESR